MSATLCLYNPAILFGLIGWRHLLSYNNTLVTFEKRAIIKDEGILDTSKYSFTSPPPELENFHFFKLFIFFLIFIFFWYGGKKKF